MKFLFASALLAFVLSGPHLSEAAALDKTGLHVSNAVRSFRDKWMQPKQIDLLSDLPGDIKSAFEGKVLLTGSLR